MIWVSGLRCFRLKRERSQAMGKSDKRAQALTPTCAETSSAMTTCASLRAMASRASAANFTHECTHPLTHPRTCTTHTDTDTDTYTSTQGKRVSNSPCVYHRPSQQSQYPPIRPLLSLLLHIYHKWQSGTNQVERGWRDTRDNTGVAKAGQEMGLLSVSRGQKGARASALPFRAAFPEHILIRLNFKQERHPVMRQVPLLSLNPIN